MLSASVIELQSCRPDHEEKDSVFGCHRENSRLVENQKEKEEGEMRPGIIWTDIAVSGGNRERTH
jgi:hypothetical protein